MAGGHDVIEGSTRVRRTALVLACAGVFAVSVSVAAIGIGLPTIATDIGATQADVTRISAATSIAFAAALLPAGAAARRFGQRRVLGLGLLVFAAAELATSGAGRADLVVVWRVLSGLGAACVLPVLLSVIIDAFPASRRPAALAVWAAVSSIGASVGGLLAGLLLEVTSWRVLPLAVGVTALVLAPLVARTAPADRDDDESIDVWGAVLVFVGLGSTVLGLTLLGGSPVPPAALWALVGGLAAIAVFAVRVRRAASPLLPPGLLRGNGSLQGGLVLAVGGAAAFGAYTFLGPQFAQFVLGASPLQTSLLFLAGDAGLLLVAPFLPRLVRRFGRLGVGCAGALLVGAGLQVLAVLGEAPLATLAGVLVVLGIGIAAVTATAADLVVSGVREDDRSWATAASYLGRDVGTAVGGAVVGTVLAAGFRASIAPSASDLPSEQAAEVTAGFATAVETAESLPGPQGAELARAADEAFTAAYQYGLVSAGVIAVLAAGAAWRLGRGAVGVGAGTALR